jgi:UDP-N-acetylmuramoyl-tripeptide--D-alanyl-D-alanine ligase
MVVRFEQLQELWGDPISAAAPSRSRGASIQAVSTDSRADLTGCLFVPLVGERFDGHRFLPTALEKAAAAIAQADRIDIAALGALADRQGCPLWLVGDTLQAYQDLARLWRRCLAAPVVAVTGSAGKTTTRELIRACLEPLGPVVASSGNENNDIGAPLTLLRAGQDTAALVVEMGMRGLGEIERLSRCAEPDIAVITNIGTAHIGRLGSREAIASAKCEITAALRPGGLLVIPAGDPLLEQALTTSWRGRVVRVALADDLAGFNPELPCADMIGHLDLASGEPQQLQLEGRPPIPLPLAGRHNARNLLLSLAVAQELGVAPTSFERLAVAVPGGRSRRLNMAGLQVLDETYNASPEAMLAALDLLAGSSGGRRFAVLGTMLELGEQSLALHREVGDRARELADRGLLQGLVIVDGGAEGAALEAGAAGSLAQLARVETPLQAVEALIPWLAPGDWVLLKASRGVALEQALPLLETKLEQRRKEGSQSGPSQFSFTS